MEQTHTHTHTRENIAHRPKKDRTNKRDIAHIHIFSQSVIFSTSRIDTAREKLFLLVLFLPTLTVYACTSSIYACNSFYFNDIFHQYLRIFPFLSSRIRLFFFFIFFLFWYSYLVLIRSENVRLLFCRSCWAAIVVVDVVVDDDILL